MIFYKMTPFVYDFDDSSLHQLLSYFYQSQLETTSIHLMISSLQTRTIRNNFGVGKKTILGREEFNMFSNLQVRANSQLEKKIEKLFPVM